MRKTRSEKWNVAKEMPPLRHSIPGQEYDVMQSEVVMWLCDQPDILQLMFNAAKDGGEIRYNSETGKWQGWTTMGIEFFMMMIPPTVTAQQHKVNTQGEKPVFYDPPELKEARAKLMAYLGPYAPPERFKGPLQLVVKWCFPITGKHVDGEYKTSRPDTDNLQKLFKDCMTKLGYWRDDAQVTSEVVEKFWARIPGVYVAVRELPKVAE